MPEKSIGKYVSIISRYLNYYINKKVKDFKINKTQVEILMVLYYEEGINQYQLGERLMLDKITITKQLGNLIEEGYARKESGREDKRVRELYVTDKGFEIKNEIEKILKEATEVLAKDFDEEENKIIRKLLKRMSYNIYQEVNK